MMVGCDYMKVMFLCITLKIILHIILLLSLSLLECGFLTIAFWITQNTLQAVKGLFGIHAGKSLPIVFATGLISTLCSQSIVHYISIENRQIAHEYISNYGNKRIKTDKNNRNIDIKYEFAKRVMLGLGMYLLLERKAFKTVLPSSILTTGAYANFARGAVQATGAVATSSQRFAIQRLGKLYGCHHCGTKQIFSADKFIADHMPPTKFVNEMNKKWWRRMLKITVEQKLLPQCQKCFSKQGSAVASNFHRPVYHFRFRSPHLAAALALVLVQDKELDGMINPIFEKIDRIAFK